MKSVIYITATNLRVYYRGTIFKANSEGPNTQLEDMTFPETSNLLNFSSIDTTIVSFTKENIVIQSTNIPYVSPDCQKNGVFFYFGLGSMCK